MFFLNVGFEHWFRGNISAPKVGSVDQALHGFLEFELYKTRSNNYLNLRKTNKFTLLHQHVCNKCLQHLATSSTRHYFASHWLVFHMMQPMSASPCTTTHWPMLKFGGVSSSVVMLAIYIMAIQFPDAQKCTIQCFAQHQFSLEYSAFGVLWAL